MPYRSHRHDGERSAEQDGEQDDPTDTGCDEECHEAPFGPDGPATPVWTSHQSTRATSQTPVLPRLVRRVVPETPGRSFNRFALSLRRFAVRRAACDMRRSTCPTAIQQVASDVRRSRAALEVRRAASDTRHAPWGFDVRRSWAQQHLCRPSTLVVARETLRESFTPPLFQDTLPAWPQRLRRLHPRCAPGPSRPPLRPGLSDTRRGCDS